jgi:hypothetical protein
VQRRDKILRDPAQPESARSDRHVVVKQAGQGGSGIRVNFAHVEVDLTMKCTNQKSFVIRDDR